MTSKSCYPWFVDLCHVFYWTQNFDGNPTEYCWQGWAQIGVIEQPRSRASTIPSLFQKNMVWTEIFHQLCDPRQILSFLSLSYKVISINFTLVSKDFFEWLQYTIPKSHEISIHRTPTIVGSSWVFNHPSKSSALGSEKKDAGTNQPCSSTERL